MKKITSISVVPGTTLTLFFLPLLMFTSAAYLEALDDSILHKIDWAGPLPDDKPFVSCHLLILSCIKYILKVPCQKSILNIVSMNH